MDVMYKKTGKFLFFILLVFVLKPLSVFGQGDCECTNCPQFMPDFFVGDISLTVQNATVDDLSDPSQGICGVAFELDHQYIGDLLIELIAPSGQSIVLVGGIGLTGETDLTKWDITFVPSSSTAVPDAGYSAKWSNAQTWGLGNTYTGSYYPFSGNLEDFNSGPVNGTWTIKVTDGQANDVGTVLNFSIEFCEPDGISCSTNPCGNYVDLDYESLFCSGENVIIDGSNSISGPGISYIWTTSDGTFAPGTDINSPIIEVEASGTYTLTIRHNGGCPEEKDAIITLLGDAPDMAIAEPDVITCSISEIFLNAAGSSTNNTIIQWYDGVIINDQNANNLLGSELTQIVTTPGIYTLQVVNTESGCYRDTIIEVLGVYDYPELDIPVPDTINCLSTSIDIDPNSSTSANSDTISWSGPNGFTSGTLSINALDSGTYYITLTNILGCKTLDSIEIVKNTDSPADIQTSAEIIHCNTPTVQISASSSTDGVNFVWSGPNNYSSSDQNPNDINEAGDYSVLVTASNGCTSTEIVSVTSDVIPPDLALSFTNENTIDCNITALGIETTVTDNNLTFDWSSSNNNFSENTSVISISEAGIYEVTVTDGNGCTNIESIEVLGDLNKPQDIVVGANIITCKENAEIQVTSTTPNTTVNWDGPMGLTSDQTNFTSAAAGNYTVTVTGENGCTETEVLLVTEDKTPPDASGSGGIITCAAGSVSLTGSSTYSNVTYSWTGPNGFVSNEQNPVVGADGSYTLITTAENGCESDPAIAIVTNDNGVPNISATTMNSILTLDCNNSSIDLIGNSTSSDVTYEWLGPNLSTTQTTATISEQGTYTFTVLATNGCKSETNVVIVEDFSEPTDINFEKKTIDCNNPTLDIKVNSSTADLTYNWSGNGFTSNTSTLQVDQGGDYLVTITSSNGCFVEAMVTVDENKDPPVVEIGPEKTIDCINKTAQIGTMNSSSGPEFTYQWLNSGNAPQGNDMTLTVSNQDDYTLIITNTTNGCVEQETVHVEEDKELPNNVEINPDGLIIDCEMTEISTNTMFSNVTNPSYSWSGPNGNLGTDKDIIISDAGKYTFVITNDDTGCSSMASVSVISDIEPPNVSSINGKIPCIPGTFDLVAFSSTDNTTFMWESPSGIEEAGQTWTISEPGIYTLVATGPNSCTAEVNVEVITDDGVPELKLTGIEQLTCKIEEIVIDASSSTLSGTGQIEYTWLDANNVSIGTNALLIVKEVGDYTLREVNNSNGCEISKTISITEDKVSPVADAGMDQDFTCQDTEKMLSAENSSPMSGDMLTYRWKKNGEIIGVLEQITITTDGVFTVVVTDTKNGCRDSSMVIITPDKNKPEADIAVSGILTCLDLTVELNAENSKVATSSAGNLSFEWIDSGETTSIFEVNEPGVYILRLKDDSNGCIKDTPILVEQNIEEPLINVSAPNKITCSIEEVEISGDGSKLMNTKFLWSSSTNETIEDSDQLIAKVTQAGKYELVVTDLENGCTNSKEIEVFEDKEPPIVDAVVDGEIDCVIKEVMLSIGNSSKGDKFNYLWKGPNLSVNDKEVSVNEAGTYVLSIKNSENDCLDSDEIQVKKQPEINGFDNSLNNQSCLSVNSGSIEFKVIEGGTPPYMYSIDGGSTFSNSAIFENLAPGSYEIVVQGSKGCEYNKDLEIETYIQPTLELGDDITIVLGQSVSIDPSFENIAADSMIWSIDSLHGFNPTLFPIETTFVEATVYDEMGCLASDRLTIFVEKIRPVYIPSAFSPNGDGNNDVFTVYSGNNLAVKNIISMRIFDRWGTMVFQNYDFKSDDVKNGWDGLVSGDRQNGGVYGYFIEVEFLDGSKELYKGDISLLR